MAQIVCYGMGSRYSDPLVHSLRRRLHSIGFELATAAAFGVNNIMEVNPMVALRAALVGGIAAFAKIGAAMKAAGGAKVGAAAAAMTAAATAAVSGKEASKENPKTGTK
uniref:Uncharacterized protein n=1 Tax=Leersia perrieri TaxID=77586 RepID=A0A0D9WLY6_9ORYZ